MTVSLPNPNFSLKRNARRRKMACRSRVAFVYLIIFFTEELDDSLLRSIDVDHDAEIMKVFSTSSPCLSFRFLISSSFQEFNEDIDKTVRDLENLNEIANDLQVEVAEQKEQLDVVEENALEADSATMGAVVDLGEARKTQSKTRTTKSMMAGAGSCALTFGIAGLHMFRERKENEKAAKKEGE